ncbi:hypothetical protein ES705_38238 [subsurface metagenome]
MPKKKKTSKITEVPVSNRSVSVDIKKANNGFVVSSWDLDKQKTYIAKSKKEALKYASKILTKGV